MWLRICELINDPLTDWRDALDEILWMNAGFSGTYTLAVLTASAAKDICLLNGVGWPAQVLWTGGYLRDASIAEAVLSDPVPNIPFTIVDRVCGMEVLRSVPDREQFAERFSACLRAILSEERRKDSRLWDPECFGTRKVLLFDGFAYYGRDEYAEARILAGDRTGPWSDLFRGTAATVFASLYWNRDDIPWKEALLLTDAQAETARIALDDDHDVQYAQPEAEEWSAGTEPDDGFPLNPVVHEDMRANMAHPRRDAFRASIRAHRDAVGRRDAPFVPSGHWCMNYDVMTPEQKDFYLSWRSEVLNGNYRDTDRGYLWLLLCETIDSDSNPVRRMAVLTGLLRAYGQSSDSIRGLISRTCQDYAIVTGQDPPWDASDRDQQLILWVKLSVSPLGLVPLALAVPYMSGETEQYCTSDADYETGFNIALKALAGNVMSRTGMSLAESIPTRTKKVYRKLFPGLSSDWGSCCLNVCEFRPSNAGGRMLTSAFRASTRCINVARGIRAPRRMSGVDPGDEAAMEDAVDEWIARSRRERRAEAVRREADSIVIDRDAVRSAEDDLAAVRMMMDTDEEPDLPEVPIPEPVSMLTGWSLLASSLDSVQMGYLRACLDGTGGAFARSSGRTAVRLDDEINALSMDAVGDQIVEDGEVFEDYAEDVRRMVVASSV